MSKLWYALFGIFIGAVSFISLSAHAQVSTNYWKFSSNYILPNVASWGLQIPSLSNLACIGTDSTGKFQSGTCGGGGGTISTSSPLVAGQGVYATGVNTIASVATSTPSLDLGLSYSGTLGNFYSGTSGTLSIATSSLYTGTTGQIPYFDGTNSISGTSTIFISSSKRVGIGTTSPKFPFEVVNPVGGTDERLNCASNANVAVSASTVGSVCLVVGNGSSFSTGYGAIAGFKGNGTAINWFNLTPFGTDFQLPISTANNKFYTSATTLGQSVPLIGITAGNIVQVGMNYPAADPLEIYTGSTATNITFKEKTTATTLAVLTGGGNFGLGTTSPYAMLSVGGGDLVLGGATAGGTPGDLYLPKLGTAAGAFLAVDASGKVIATTTPSGGGVSTATYPLQVSGSNISLAFGTTTSNTWAGTQTFTNAPVVSAFGAGALYSTSAGLIQTHATSSASAASQDVWRDANQNAFAQNFVSAATTFPSLGTTATLTAASPRTWVVTGTNTQTFKLPVGTTLTAGAQYNFNNNSTGVITVVDNGSNTLGVVPSGGSSFFQIYDVSTSNGSWDAHARLGHNNVSGTGTLGIGTTSPGSALSVQGNFFLAGNIVSTSTATSTFAGGLQSVTAYFSGLVEFAGAVIHQAQDLFNAGIQLAANTYLNFGATTGSSGYGFRDNSGTIEFKNSGGSWVGVGASQVIDYQTFTSTTSPGTWTKPSGLTGNEMVVIQAWGAGGGGAANNGRGGPGGGGGNYTIAYFKASTLGSTETVTIGSGGAGGSGGSSGGVGGDTTFGTWLTSYGGGGGGIGGGTSGSGGGGGGGALADGSTGSGTTGGSGGGPGGSAASTGNSGFAGAGGGSASTVGGASAYGGAGGGGSSSNTTSAIAGGNSIYGGGGGGAGPSTGTNTGAGGTSMFAGAGGTGSLSSCTIGGFPAGGGGGGSTGCAGGRGEVRVWVIKS